MKKAIRKRIMAAVLLCAMVMTTLLGQAGTLETKAAVAHFDGNDYRMSGQVDEGFYDDESSSVMGYTKGILVKDILPFVKELMCHIGRTIGVRLTGVQ